ncbi:sperm-associated antigen 17 isoform X3 [Heterodontus francisci]|uniref:sperm-associated antigen 17 isoform X3 n=1 Tax=Heterodontus francisci TaxID=7792 RepID=UPI00355AFBB6
MPAKKAKGSKAAKEPQTNLKPWEPGLLAAQIEEDQWKPAIYFTVGEKIENEMFLAALSAAINVPLRKLFSIISWEGTMKQIVEFGNPKGKKPSELPMFYEVTEVAWEMLAKGEELSLPLLSKIVKFQILCIKQKDLQRKETVNKVTVEEEATMPASANKKKKDKKSAGKGKGKAERKSPEPPLIRKNTKLLKRGEVEVIDRCINDEPDDGPQHYIIIQGFQNLQFLLMLGELGINISAVIMISYEKNESFLKEDATESEIDLFQPPEAIEVEKKQKEEANKSLENFWKYLDPVLSSGKPGSKLFDIARLQYTVKEAILPQDWNNDEMKLEFGATIFEDIASMIYDCEDWKRQYQNYLRNIKLITVPKASKDEEMLALPTPTPISRKKPYSAELASPLEKDTSTALVDMRYYNDLMSLVPLESLSVPLILHCILDQVVATEESLTPPSELIPKPREDGLDQRLVDHMISSVLSLSLSEDDKQKMIEEFKEPPQKTVNEISTQPSFCDVIKDQAVVTEEDKLRPSEEGPEPQTGVQKSVLAKEQQIMIEELKKSEQKRPYEELKQPLLLNLHDNLTWRTHHLKVLQGFDPAKIEQEMMKKLPLGKFLNFTHPLPENDAKRLAAIQELMYHCTNENVTSSEVERAFKQFVFESMKFTKVKENGELEEKMLAESLELAPIPWDDPVRFAKEIKWIVNAKKTRKQSNCAADLSTRSSEGAEAWLFQANSSVSRESTMSSMEPPCSVNFEDTSEMVDKKNRKNSLTDAEDKKDKAVNPMIDIKYIQKLQLRSLMEWCFAEQHDPFVLMQVLQEAVQFYRCVDTYYYKQDNSILLVLHNPMNKQRQCNQSWEAALHSNVGFRNYLEYVAYSISDWVDEEEAKYQDELAAKELEALKLPKFPSDVSPEPLSSSSEKQKKGKAGSANKPRMSSSRQQTKTEIEEEEEKYNEPFMREGSLKAWKKDQERLKEEEQKKEKKGKKDRPVSKKKEENVRKLASTASRSSKKSAKQDSKKVKEEQEIISKVEPEAQEPAEPIEQSYQFIGYNFGNDLIRVSGEVKSLFPADGGHIQAKITQFLHGSTIIQVCVMKDRHQFFTYITDPMKNLGDSEEIPTEKTGSESSEKEEEWTEVSISKFRSFSAILDDGITVTLSKHAPAKAQKKVKEDPVLADILRIPSVQTLTPVPVVTPSVTGKPDKSTKNKNPQSAKGKQKKETSLSPAAEEPEQLKEEPKVEIEEHEPAAPSEDGPEPSVFLCLNACSPDGLLITYFTEDSIGIKDEDMSEERILLRQSYPIKTKGTQPCEAARKWPVMQEASRVITLQGTVVKYMMDGSTEILFSDGTVSRSPDSGPVSIPQTPIMVSDQTDPVDQESKDEKELKRDSSEEGSKKGKHGHRGNSAPNISETFTMQTQPSDTLPGTWLTTTPIGLTIGTKGTEKLDIKPILVYKATDPGTGEVMITRQDKVVTVFGSDSTIVEHADGTRITTFFQDKTIPENEMQYETEEIPHKVTRHVKCIKVECVGFATVLMNWEDCTCSAVFGNGTTIITKPQGMYQVFPASVGCLLIDQDGSAMYTSETNNDVITHPTVSQMELQPGAYFMKSTSLVICEVMDPEQNFFQVTVDGNTFAFTHNGSQEGEEEDALLQSHMIKQNYSKHAPRFFILYADGSGTELLRSSDVEEYLHRAYSSPATAVLKEQLPEFPGVLGITFLQPSTEDIGSHWLIKKDVANIIPPNLQSRKWDTFPQAEYKIPGPHVGTYLYNLHNQQVDSSSPPVLKCPSVLEVRQLFQYEPINTEMRHKLQSCLKKYIELSLQKEQELNDMLLKEPRNEEELVHAADLLKLVLSFPDDDVCQREDNEANKVDVAAIYENAVGSTFKTTPEMATCEWTKVNLESNERQNQIWRWPQRLEQFREELDEVKGTKLALKNMIVPSYFQSDLCKAFDLAQGHEMDYLPKSFPMSQRMKVPEGFNGSAAPNTDVSNRSTYPMPAHTTGTDTCSLKRSDYPTQQTVTSQSQRSTEDVSNGPTYTTPAYTSGTDTCSLKRSENPTQQTMISQSQHATEDVSNGPTDKIPAYISGTDTCSLKRSENPTQQAMIFQSQHATEDISNGPTDKTPSYATGTDTCSLKTSENPTQQAMISQSQHATEDVSNGPTDKTPAYTSGTDTCSLKRSENPTQQAMIFQSQHATEDACNRLLNPTCTHTTKAKTCPMRFDVRVPQTMIPRCQHSTTINPLLSGADEQDLSTHKPNNCCSLHKPLSIPGDVLKDIGSKNGVLQYRPEELPADGSNIIFNKSLIIDAANQPRKEKIKLPSAILSSKPGSLPNQRFTVIEEPVRRKVNTISIAGPIAGGILKKPTRGFEMFPRKVNFGILQEGFTYTYTVLLKNVGIDTCRFRVKQPPPSTGLRVCFKPGPVAAGLATELEIELYAMAIGLECPEGAGYLYHHLEIQTEVEELFLPIIATVLTENVYKNRPEEFPKGGKAAGVHLICTDPTSRMDIIRPRKPPAEDPFGTYVLCGT